MTAHKHEAALAIGTARRIVAARSVTASNLALPTGDEHSASSHDLVTLLVKTVLSPRLAERRLNLAADLAAVSSTISVLVASVEDGTLEESEFSAVLRVVATNFTTRRFDRIFQHIAEAPKSNWFVASSRSSHG